MIAEKLDLSDAQKEQMAELRKDARREKILRHGRMADLRARMEVEFLEDQVDAEAVRQIARELRAVRAELEEARLEQRLAIMGILTPQQRETLQEMRMRHRVMRHHRSEMHREMRMHQRELRHHRRMQMLYGPGAPRSESEWTPEGELGQAWQAEPGWTPRAEPESVDLDPMLVEPWVELFDDEPFPVAPVPFEEFLFEPEAPVAPPAPLARTIE
jgi:Spy/CpxP family protein refolding chaperone